MKSPNTVINGINTDDALNVNVVNTDDALNVNVVNTNTQSGVHELILPSILPVPTTEQNTGGVLVRHLTDDGVLYGARDADVRIFKSLDFGATWTAIASSAALSKSPSNIHKYDDGRLLVITSFGGEAWLSDENEENFVFKYNFETGVGGAFGVDVYGDMVLVAGYGGGTNYDKCFMSKNRGETWEVILQHPDPSISHFHDITYDPYEGIIWASCGDYGEKNNIFWSSDFGETWGTTYGIEGSSIRVTAIIPLPKCVLFVSDTDVDIFVWRYDRHPEGTLGHQVEPYKAWYYKRDITIDKSDFVGSRPTITYGANSSAFFGWHCYTPGSDVTRGHVFATKDGYSFTPVWTSKNLMNAYSTDYSDGGVMGVFGPTNKNELVAFYTEGNKDEMDLPERYAIKLDFPGWG